MQPATIRRKNQKKKKRRERKRCSFCGCGHPICTLAQIGTAHRLNPETPVKVCRKCRRIQILAVRCTAKANHFTERVLELADKYPDGIPFGERRNGRAGSNPASLHFFVDGVEVGPIRF